MIHIIKSVIQDIHTIIGLRNRKVLIEALFYSYLLVKELPDSYWSSVKIAPGAGSPGGPGRCAPGNFKKLSLPRAGDICCRRAGLIKLNQTLHGEMIYDMKFYYL
jgi:hypothetical protein